MTKVIVYHAAYGCETGCCGHVVEMDGDKEFFFRHPWQPFALIKKGRSQTARKFAEELVEKAFGAEHVKDLDWDNCRIEDD